MLIGQYRGISRDSQIRLSGCRRSTSVVLRDSVVHGQGKSEWGHWQAWRVEQENAVICGSCSLDESAPFSGCHRAEISEVELNIRLGRLRAACSESSNFG